MKNIVLDCDGVILDYVSTYGFVLSQFFKKEFKPKKLAYHAHNVFEHQLLNHQKKEFFDLFHEIGWSHMKLLPGAFNAIQILKEKNFNIHIVTSIPNKAYNLRLENLKKLNIPFDSFHTSDNSNFNPKKDIVNSINPDFFLDDLLQNFHGINHTTHCSLIHIPGNDNPNYEYSKNYKSNYHSKFKSLLDFSLSL